MRRYALKVEHRIVYSIGDTHGRGLEVANFISNLRQYAKAHGESPLFIQLGDLGDCFTLPNGLNPHALSRTDRANLRAIIAQRIAASPLLAKAAAEPRQFVHWRRFPGSARNGEVKAVLPASSFINSDDPDILSSFCQAVMCFETLIRFSQDTQEHDDFIVIFGNHDADLLRGCADYGRQQKYILLGLLGFEPDEVIEHMIHGLPKRILDSPWCAWLSQRPHIVLSDDTIYMHGGPTGELSRQLDTGTSFEFWLDNLEIARQNGWTDHNFIEHNSFLSPDGKDNDWLTHPETIRIFCKAAQKQFLAVGHSPFLDFEKGPLIDLAHAQDLMPLFRTPAQLPPDGKLIKHDVDLKRGGELWACRHETGSLLWTGINRHLQQYPLRGLSS